MIDSVLRLTWDFWNSKNARLLLGTGLIIKWFMLVYSELLILLKQGLTATGVKKDHIFIGDVNTQYKSGNTTVNLKVDTYSNVSIYYFTILPFVFAVLNFIFLCWILFVNEANIHLVIRAIAKGPKHYDFSVLMSFVLICYTGLHKSDCWWSFTWHQNSS